MKLSTCTEWLYFHLWKKNPQTGQSCGGVFLADTVIYRWAQPYFRYFTAPNGTIIRKTKERVFIEQVDKSFCENDNVVAVLLTSQQISKEQESINFEYFDKQSFNKFLYQREKELNSILQKFIPPKGDKNSLIKVSWSPQFCLLHRRTNVNNMKDNIKQIHEKVSTFEGPEYLTNSDSISSPILSSDLEQLCVNIVKHVQEVSGGNIQIIRMVLYFKVDENNRIWLLFCTGIKVRDKFTATSESQIRPQSPIFKMIRRDMEPVSMGGENIQKALKVDNEGRIKELQFQFENICSNCDIFASQLYGLKFQYIALSFQKGMLDNQLTRLPEQLQAIKDKNELKLQQMQINQKIKKRQKQFVNHNYETQNVFETKSLNQSEQEILVDKFKLVNYKRTQDEIQQEIKELCQQLDEDQEDQKVNFNGVPSLILKVWGKLSDNKYAQLKLNPSWTELKTMVCIDCFLKYTQCLDQTKLERNIQTVAVSLRNKLDQQSENGIQNTLGSYHKSTSIKQLPPVNSEIKQLQQKQTLTVDNKPTPLSTPKKNVPQFFQNFIKSEVKLVKPMKKQVTTQQIYQNKQGLHISLNTSQQSKTSKSTLDQSRVSMDFMINTVSQLKKKLMELEDQQQQEQLSTIQKVTDTNHNIPQDQDQDTLPQTQQQSNDFEQKQDIEEPVQ